MNLTAIKYGSTFLAGVFAMWLWHSHVVSGMKADEAIEESQGAQFVVEAVTNDAKKAGDNSENYLSQYNAAQAEVVSLRDQLRTDAVRLRVCQAESTTAGVQADNAGAIADEARADRASSEERAIRLYEQALSLDAWVASCYAWVNR